MKKHKHEIILHETVESFKRLREEKGLTQYTLAEKSGISRSAISHIESGNRKPSLHVAIRIAESLDHKLSDVLSAIERANK